MDDAIQMTYHGRACIVVEKRNNSRKYGGAIGIGSSTSGRYHLVHLRRVCQPSDCGVGSANSPHHARVRIGYASAFVADLRELQGGPDSFPVKQIACCTVQMGQTGLRQCRDQDWRQSCRDWMCRAQTSSTKRCEAPTMTRAKGVPQMGHVVDATSSEGCASSRGAERFSCLRELSSPPSQSAFNSPRRAHRPAHRQRHPKIQNAASPRSPVGTTQLRIRRKEGERSPRARHPFQLRLVLTVTACAVASASCRTSSMLP